MIHLFPAHGAQFALDSTGHIATGNIKQFAETPHKCVGTLSLDGGTKVLKGSAVALCIDGDVRVLKC